jgi:hypothetical protein
MTTPKLSTAALMLTIVLWGTLLGGIAYSHLVYFPPYLSALPDSAIIVTGPYGLHEARFWMTIHPLLILSLIASLVLNWRLPARRKMILISACVYVTILVITSAYFIPELIAFESSAKSNVTAAEWFIRGQRWQRLSWIRGAICYIAFVPLLIALTKPAGLSPASETATAGNG